MRSCPFLPRLPALAVLGAALVPLAGPALAATVRVTSGEHGDFTRIVVDAGAPLRWSLGRDGQGYRLALDGPLDSIDLATAFTRIGRSRLAEIEPDPATGSMALVLACACHAVPFEYGPGVIVIDIRDGPAAEGSAFEAPASAPAPAVTPAAIPGAAAGPPSGGRETGYDWTARIGPLSADPPGPVPLEAVAMAPDAAPGVAPHGVPDQLRDDILWQLSRGVAQGVVEPDPQALSATIPDAVASAEPAGPAPVSVTAAEAGLRIRPPGLDLRPANAPQVPLTADGAACLDATALDLSAWLVAENRAATGILAEFDRPDPDAVRHHVRALIATGFGAEARATLRAFAVPPLPEDAVLTALAHLVDGRPDPAATFAGMEVCATPAALWALVSGPQQQAPGAPDTDAALRAFAALPAHLRRAVGPGLASRLLDIGADPAARVVRDAIGRAAPDHDGRAHLVTAALDLKRGDTDAAAASARKAQADGSVRPQAILAEAEASLAADGRLDPALLTALLAALREAAGTETEAGFARASIRALAAAGEAAAAATLLSDWPDHRAAFWAALATHGSDADLLDQAFAETAGGPAAADPDSARRIAARLAGLGFAEAAHNWLRAAGPDPTTDALEARLALDLGEPERALAGLSAAAAGADAAAADAALRGRAFTALGRHADAAGAFAAARDPASSSAALARAGAYQALSQSAPAWGAAGRLLGTEATDDAAAPDTPRPDTPEERAPADAPAREEARAEAGPLAEGAALLDRAAETRAAAADLLAAVPVPAP